MSARDIKGTWPHLLAWEGEVLLWAELIIGEGWSVSFVVKARGTEVLRTGQLGEAARTFDKLVEKERT